MPLFLKSLRSKSTGTRRSGWLRGASSKDKYNTHAICVFLVCVSLSALFVGIWSMGTIQSFSLFSHTKPSQCSWMGQSDDSSVHPSLSIIMAVYSGAGNSEEENSRKAQRFKRLVQQLTQFHWDDRLKANMEVIIVETAYYQPVGIEQQYAGAYPKQYFHDMSEVYQAKYQIGVPVRWVLVNKTVHDMITQQVVDDVSHMGGRMGTNCEHHEGIARNIGARRACGSWLWFTTDEAMFTRRFLEFIQSQILGPDKLSTRTLYVSTESIPTGTFEEYGQCPCLEDDVLTMNDLPFPIDKKNYLSAKHCSWSDRPAVNMDEVDEFKALQVSKEFMLVHRNAFKLMGGFLEAPQWAGLSNEFGFRFAAYGKRASLTVASKEINTQCQVLRQVEKEFKVRELAKYETGRTGKNRVKRLRDNGRNKFEMTRVDYCNRLWWGFEHPYRKFWPRKFYENWTNFVGSRAYKYLVECALIEKCMGEKREGNKFGKFLNANYWGLGGVDIDEVIWPAYR